MVHLAANAAATPSFWTMWAVSNRLTDFAYSIEDGSDGSDGSESCDAMPGSKLAKVATGAGVAAVAKGAAE